MQDTFALMIPFVYEYTVQIPRVPRIKDTPLQPFISFLFHAHVHEHKHAHGQIFTIRTVDNDWYVDAYNVITPINDTARALDPPRGMTIQQYRWNAQFGVH